MSGGNWNIGVSGAEILAGEAREDILEEIDDGGDGRSWYCGRVRSK